MTPTQISKSCHQQEDSDTSGFLLLRWCRSGWKVTQRARYCQLLIWSSLELHIISKNKNETWRILSIFNLETRWNIKMSPVSTLKNISTINHMKTRYRIHCTALFILCPPSFPLKFHIYSIRLYKTFKGTWGIFFLTWNFLLNSSQRV